MPISLIPSVQSISQNVATSESLTDIQLQETISQLNTNQIDAIAKQIIRTIVSHLDIDFRNDQYDPNSQLLLTFLPLIQARITEAFSTTDFLENGIIFEFFNFDKTGLLDQITDSRLAHEVQNKRDKDNLFVTLQASKIYTEELLHPPGSNLPGALCFKIILFDGTNTWAVAKALSLIETEAIQHTNDF